MKKGDLVLVIISLMFCAFIAESVLYLAKVQPYSDFRLGVKGKHPFKDKRTKAKFVQEARENGVKMVPDIPPHTFIKSNGLRFKQDRLFPVASIANTATAYCNVYGERLVYESDRYGFRNPNSVHDKKNIDILIVGDSFSAGHCEKRDIGTLLREKVNNTLNMAYGGNGPLIELAALREYGADTKPNVLLWIYFEGNDLKNIKQESASPILMNYLDPAYSQSLKIKQREIDQLLNQHVDEQLIYQLNKEDAKIEPRNVLFLKGLRFNLRRSYKKIQRAFYPLEEFEPYLPLLSKVLARAKADVSTWGGEMYFVYLPQRERYGGPVNELRLHTYSARVMELVDDLDIPIIDFGETLGKVDNPRSYFPYGIKGHYNQKGYELLSEQILTRLNQRSDTP